MELPRFANSPDGYWGSSSLRAAIAAPVPVETALTSLINEIDSLKRELILIPDDYHLIDTPDIHEAVGFMIEHLSAHMCLVIATRTDPPLPLHRLRARGEMTEIRAQELRFSSQETRTFLEGILDTSLSTSGNVFFAPSKNSARRVEEGVSIIDYSLAYRDHVPMDFTSFTEKTYNWLTSERE